MEFPLELSAKSVCSFRSVQPSEGTCVFLKKERQNVNIEEAMQEEYVPKHKICHMRDFRTYCIFIENDNIFEDKKVQLCT